jgi:hypothetical protein
MGWPPWMVAVVGMDHSRGVGTMAGLEPAIRGPALGAPMESEENAGGVGALGGGAADGAVDDTTECRDGGATLA